MQKKLAVYYAGSGRAELEFEKNMIGVLHVINWFRRGGVEMQLLQILEKYDRSRFLMDVCCIGDEEGYLADEARQYGAKIIMCRKSPNMAAFASRFQNKIQNANYDIVHAQLGAWSGPLLRGASRAGAPVRIAHYHSSASIGRGLGESLPQSIARNIVDTWGAYWIRKYATNVLGVSQTALDARYPEWRTDSEKCMVWTAGVDTEKFKPRGEKQFSAVPRLVYVSSFQDIKRQDLAITILGKVREKYPQARLKLVGEGATKKYCEDFAAKNNLADSVDFTGLRNDIPEILNTSDIFISCSELEGLPSVVLEAQAAGLPVIATDIPQHREALAPELRPFLFKHNEIDLAAYNIIKIFGDSKLYADLSLKSREYVLKYFSVYHTLDRLQSLYCKWVESRKDKKL